MIQEGLITALSMRPTDTPVVMQAVKDITATEITIHACFGGFDKAATNKATALSMCRSRCDTAPFQTMRTCTNRRVF